MVLMAALTTGAATPDCHRGFGGGCYCGCYGGGGGHGWGGGHGCYGGCYGCYGGYSWSSCYGCYGGYACNGGYGCYSAWGCAGCYGGGYGGVYGGGYLVPSMPGTPGGTEDKKGTLPPPKPGSGTEEVRASLVVELPADAKLFVDGQAMKTTSPTRRFVTPPLQRGQAYFYDLRAEVVRDGQTLTQSRRVIVRPGEDARATFTDLQSPPNATAQAGTR
jgi:uncharacterized protein (TIGR03000 family)